MSIPLRLLAVEDSADDTELIVYALRRGGFEPTWRRADTAEALRAALTEEPWDVITCDFVMPAFGALPALEIIRELAPETPAIVVTGEVGEEFAVTAMRAGASDFVSKHRLSRLAPAIARDLREGEARRARRAAEAAQQASEEQFRLLFEHSLDAILISDDAGRFRAANRAACELFGLEREQLLGMGVAELAAGFGASLIDRFLAYRRSGQRFGEFAFTRPDGESRVAEYAACALAPDLHFAIIRDQTARRRAEEALRQSEARWRAVIADATDLIFTLDAAGRATSVNHAVCAVTGFGAGELLGRSPLELVAPERLAEAAQALATVLGGGSVDAAEVEIVAKDGQRRVLEVRGRTSRDGARVVETFHIARDITERKRTERRLAMVVAANRALVQSATAEERIAAVLRAVGESGEWELGAWWSVCDGALTQRLARVCGDDAAAAQALERSGSGLTMPVGVGLPGRALAAGGPLWFAPISPDDAATQSAVFEALGVRSAVAFPIRATDGPAGSLVFHSRAPRACDHDLLEVCGTLGEIIGRFFEPSPGS